MNPPARSGPGIGEQAIDPAELLGRSDTPPGPPPEAVCFPSQAGPVGGSSFVGQPFVPGPATPGEVLHSPSRPAATVGCGQEELTEDSGRQR